MPNVITIRNAMQNIDIDNVHSKQAKTASRYMSGFAEPPWYMNHSMNKLYCKEEKWWAYFQQYNHEPSKEHSNNRSYETMSLFQTNEIRNNDDSIWSGTMGVFSSRYLYVNAWANEARKFLQVEDGLLKINECNWSNIVKDTYHRHVNICQAFMPKLVFISAYNEYKLYREILYLENIPAATIYEFCNNLQTVFDENTKIDSWTEQTVYERKVYAQRAYHLLFQVCICLFDLVYLLEFKEMNFVFVCSVVNI